MEISVFQYAISVAAIGIYCYLLVAGFQKGFWRHLPMVYLYIGWFLASSICRWLVIGLWGYSSPAYYYFYYGSSLIDPLLQILLLVKVYDIVRSSKDKGQWLILTVFTAMMAYYVFHQASSHLFTHFHTISLYFQVLFCSLVHIQLQRNREVYLGRNYEGILYGLTIMILSMSITYGMRLFEGLPGPYFTLLMQTLSFAPWVIYVLFLRSLDLPRRAEPEVVREIEIAEANLRRMLRAIR